MGWTTFVQQSNGSEDNLFNVLLTLHALLTLFRIQTTILWEMSYSCFSDEGKETLERLNKFPRIYGW